MSTRRPLPHPPPGDIGETCVTCGDLAIALTVIEVLGSDARCQAADGAEEVVAIELVGELEPGDRVLAHAGVAIERITDPPEERMPDALR